MSTPFKNGGSISTAFRESPALAAMIESRKAAAAEVVATDEVQDILL